MLLARSVEEAKQAARQVLAASRYALEVGGILVLGASIKTDPESQAKVSGALLAVMRNPAAEIDWKGANGWVRIGKTEIEFIADAVAQHVQACFSAEKAKCDALDALTTLDEIRNFDCKVTL
jgi:hypothetical protein